MSQTYREEDLFQIIQKMQSDIERLNRRRAIPIGGVLIWPTGTEAPPGMLDCDGAVVSRADYADLFSAIGTRWGDGDGSTTFTLPLFENCFLLGAGDRLPGQVGGEENHTLSEAEMPSHVHNVGARDDSGGAAGAQNGVWTRQASYDSGNVTRSVGGGLAHNNMPPFAVVKFIIAAY